MTSRRLANEDAHRDCINHAREIITSIICSIYLQFLEVNQNFHTCIHDKVFHIIKKRLNYLGKKAVSFFGSTD